jgi:hypothetical protein
VRSLRIFVRPGDFRWTGVVGGGRSNFVHVGDAPRHAVKLLLKMMAAVGDSHARRSRFSCRPYYPPPPPRQLPSLPPPPPPRHPPPLLPPPSPPHLPPTAPHITGGSNRCSPWHCDYCAALLPRVSERIGRRGGATNCSRISVLFGSVGLCNLTQPPNFFIVFTILAFPAGA